MDAWYPAIVGHWNLVIVGQWDPVIVGHWDPVSVLLLVLLQGILDQVQKHKLLFIETQDAAETSLALLNYQKVSARLGFLSPASTPINTRKDIYIYMCL